jgi:hypothetical protein
MRDRGFVVGGARILKRVWQLYVAFIFLSVLFIAQIAYVAGRFDNPLFAEEMDVLHFLDLKCCGCGSCSPTWTSCRSTYC